MARIHGCHVTSREAILFMKYEHYGKCKGSFKDSQRKCKYLKILSGNEILTSIKSHNSVTNLRKMMVYTANLDLINVNVYAKFG